MEVMTGGGGETYTLSTQASTTPGNAILRLDGDDSDPQDIEIVGGNNITVTQAGNNQLTINATGDLTPDLDVGELQDVTITAPVAEGEVLGIVSVTDGTPAWGNVTPTTGSTVNVDSSPVTDPDFQDSTGDRAVQFTADSDGAITAIANSDSAKQDNLTAAQLNIVNNTALRNATVTALAVQADGSQTFRFTHTAVDGTTTTEDWTIPREEHVRFGQLTGTTLNLYTTNDATGTAVPVDLSNLADFPFYHFATIAELEAGTNTGLTSWTRAVFATVSDDSAAGDGSGQFATYVLTTIPSPPSLTTVLATNWTRITTPDSRIDEVCLDRWNETTERYDRVSIGTVSADDGGVTVLVGNTHWFELDGNNSDNLTAAGRTAWRTALGISDVPPAANFNTLENVDFEAATTTFSQPRFNGRLLTDANYDSVGASSFRSNAASSNARVLSWETAVDSNFQRGELELDFAANNNFRIEADLNAGIAVDITGVCLAPEFNEGVGSLPNRVRINLLVDNVQAMIDALTGFTDDAGTTWGQANILNDGVYTFGVTTSAADQAVFVSDLVRGIELQITRTITHQYAFYDEANDVLRVTDAAEFRDQLQTQPAADLLSVSTQFPTGAPVNGESRENQVPTVRGLDNFMSNLNDRSLWNTFIPLGQITSPAVSPFIGWMVHDTALNETWRWQPSADALVANSPRDDGTYVRFGGDTSVCLLYTSPSPRDS